MDNNQKNTRVRLAPSPTGHLHVGTARTALFNELFAKKHNGQLVLRLEDTDKTRSKKEYEENILEALHWLGIKWNEGPDIGGPNAPYRQSERTGLYKKSLLKLLKENKAYYCYCPLNTAKEDLLICNCSQSSSNESNLKSIIKLKVEPQKIMFPDLIRGKITVHTDSFGGDFTIARSLEDALFHLAVVVDDADMGITHVIRGDDHLSNTAKHILLQQALGYDQPQYAHIPLLLDEQRKKLSKRSGETNLLAYKDLGYLPEAMINYLALLGWSPKDDREFFTHKELVSVFSLKDVQKGGAIFSVEKLNSINKYYIRLLTKEELFEKSLPFLKKTGIDLSNAILIKNALLTEQERVSTLSELPEKIMFFLPDWKAEFKPELLFWKKNDAASTTKILKTLSDKIASLPEENFTEEKLQDTLLSWIDDLGLGRGDTLWPMRVALTGQKNSPGPFEIAAILGKKATIERIKKALEKLN